MIAILFIYIVSLFFTPIAIYLFIKMCERFRFVDDRLNGLKFYRRNVVAVYVDKHGNEVMVDRKADAQ